MRSGDADDPDVPPVFGNSRKVPAQISSIAHHVRKSGGRPRMLLLPVGELSLYKAFFSDRVYEVRAHLRGFVALATLDYFFYPAVLAHSILVVLHDFCFMY